MTTLRPDLCRVRLEHVQELVEGQDVALVGNASSILGSSWGAEIDSYDLVVRFNLGVPGKNVSATEESVGRRMDVWGGCVCPGHPILRRPRGNAVGRKAKMRDCKAIDLGSWNSRVRQAWVIPYNDWWPCEELAQKVFDGERVKADARVVLGDKPPTTGFCCAYLLLEHCSPRSVVLFGFDFWQTSSYPSGLTGSGHSGPRERDWLQGRVEIR